MPPMTHPFDPWTSADLGGVVVAFTTLTRARGYTDGVGIVWLDHRLTRVETRCTLAHELAHISLGHLGRRRPAEEDKVRALAARLLVPFGTVTEIVAEHAGQDMDICAIADRLQVTPEILEDRYNYATGAELAALAELEETHRSGPREIDRPRPPAGARRPRACPQDARPEDPTRGPGPRRVRHG